MKKLLLIGSIPPPYHGSNVYFENLLNSSINGHFEIYHVDTSDHRDLTNLSKLDLTNVYLALKNIFQLFVAIKKFKPDLIYIPPATTFLPFLRDGLFILISFYFSSAKIIIHMHAGSYFRDVFFEKSAWPIRKFIKFSVSKADLAIVVGERLKYIFDGLVKNIDFVWNGTEFFPSKELVQKKLAQNNSPKKIIKIGFLSNLLESKGIIDFIHAANILMKKYDNIEFLIAGSWWEQEPQTKNKFFNYLKDNNLGKKVKLLGPVKGKAKEKFFLDIDIFVFPTWYFFESFGIVNIEAMAAGCPVISSKNIGAIPEVVIDGVTGFLIEPKNPEKIADKLSLLIEKPELIIQMGKAARERYEKYFTFDKHIEKMIALFNKVLDEP